MPLSRFYIIPRGKSFCNEGAGAYFSLRRSKQKVFKLRLWSPIGGESLLQRSKLFACPLKPPLCKGRWHGSAVTEGLSTQIMPKFPFAFGVAESPKGDSPYGAADTLSRGLRRILCGGTCKPIAGSHAAEPMGWISSYLDRRPLPRHGGGVGGRGRCACGYFWSVSVRSTDLDFSFKKNLNSYPALQATERGLSRGNLSPLTVFCLLLHEQK